MTVFGVAARLSPDPSGLGTHRQLGYPGCLMPMLTGYPCPTCGMTTAFAHAVRGNLGSAFHAQPAGLFVAFGLAAAGVIALISLMTGLSWRVNWYRVPPARLAIGILGVVLAGWLYKIVTIDETLRRGGG